MYRSLIAAAILSLLLAGAVAADVPTTMTVQGRLTDDTGEPRTGSFFIHFRIFDQEVGGTELWPLVGPGGEGHMTSLDENGLWTLDVGHYEPLTEAVFASPECWLEVEVGDGANPYEKLERILLNTSPYAYRAGTVDGASGGDVSSDITAPSFTAGSMSQNGSIWVFQSGATKPVVHIENNQGRGGEITMFDEDAYTIVDLEADVDGEGGYLQIWGNQSQTRYFRVDGNNAGSGSPRIMMNGAGSYVEINSDESGDAAVNLPSNAINAQELLSEPGLTEDHSGVGISLSTLTWLTHESVTIETPAYGYILVSASCHAVTSGTTGQNLGRVGITELSSGGPSGPDYRAFGLSSHSSTGINYYPIHIMRVYEKPAGEYTFYFKGLADPSNPGAANTYMYWPVMTAVYFPTAYGTVVASSSPDAPVETPEGGM